MRRYYSPLEAVVMRELRLEDGPTAEDAEFYENVRREAANRGMSNVSDEDIVEALKSLEAEGEIKPA